MRRSHKVQEFIAHSSNVNCLQIGRKSSGVLVTGGDDKKVNMWAIGKTSAIMSLSGHQSPVECVSFDGEEEAVLAGASNGTLKMWDLEQQKVTRTLVGHRSNCLSVGFHPFEEFFASGSLDTNLKLWDLRSKDPMFTYKGHTAGITHLRFSPDGQLIVSGSQDGGLKLWDLLAGKLRHEFPPHDHAVTGMEFHPSEYMLATSSADRTVKFWDLETFGLVDMAGPEATAVRGICFPPDGTSLFSATQDGMRVWGWEPVVQHDMVEVGWSKHVADLAWHDGKLLGCAYSGAFVSVWVVDLLRVAPYAPAAAAQAAVVAPTRGQIGNSGRTPRITPPPLSSRHTPSALSPTPLLTPTGASAAADPAPFSSAAGRRNAPTPSRTPSTRLSGSFASMTLRKSADLVVQPSPEVVGVAVAGGGGKVMVSTGTGIGDSLAAPLQPGAFRAAALVGAAEERSQGITSVSYRDPPASARGPGPSSRSRPNSRHGTSATGHSTPASAPVSRATTPERPGRGLNIQEFLPPGKPGMAIGEGRDAEEAVLTELQAGHGGMVAVLQARLSQLEVARGFWQRRDVRGTLAALHRCADPAVIMDALSGAMQQRELWKLEHCGDAAPCAGLLLDSPHEEHIGTGIALLLMLLRCFGQIIREACSPTPPAAGVDITFESRRERCLAARQALATTYPRLQALQGRTGSLGLRANELASELSAL